MAPQHPPGSPEAIAQGCTCSPEKNLAGAGRIRPGGEQMFVARIDCPLHGVEELKRALASGDAEIIDDEPDER
jgi:hypothetical protein